MEKKILVGGQAVIEGVMMRVPGAYATAVRKPDGTIETQRKEYASVAERYPVLKTTVVRGVVALFESLKIGMSTLQLSADIALEAESAGQDEKPAKGNKIWEVLTYIFAFALAIGLFAVLPLFLTTRLLDIERKAFAFNLVAGFWRILFFFIYLWLISFAKDVQRLFQYHGAEHKVIYTFEAGKKLTVENTREYTTFHPRCGTSFIFIVLIVSILMFAIIDSVIILALGTITLKLRLVFHLLLMPFVAGVGYEFLKFTAAHQDRKWGMWLTKPGLWMQRITTKPPSDDQLEVSIAALQSAFGDKLAEYEGQTFRAEAID